MTDADGGIKNGHRLHHDTTLGEIRRKSNKADQIVHRRSVTERQFVAQDIAARHGNQSWPGCANLDSTSRRKPSCFFSATAAKAALKSKSPAHIPDCDRRRGTPTSRARR